MKLCSINNCNKLVYCKNKCTKHYQQVLIFGDIKRTRFDSNKIIIRGNECEMYLYDKFGEYIKSTFFDLKFLEKIKIHKWYCHKPKNTYYVITNLKLLNKKSESLKLHQLILPCEGPLMIDHKDRNGLNNRLSNLRIVTNRVNTENKRNNTSGYTGVTWDKDYKRYVARIWFKGKNKYLGGFKTSLEGFKTREKFKKDNNIK